MHMEMEMDMGMGMGMDTAGMDNIDFEDDQG
jgi:hypothetical protein